MTAWLRRSCCRIFASFRKPALDRDFQEEIESHVEMLTEDNIKRGMGKKEARREAILEIGGLESLKDLHRDTRGLSLLENTWRDLRFAFRMLARKPLFTAVIVITLGLGIRANSAVFSIINTVLLRPLPFPEPDGIIRINETNLSKGFSSFSVSAANFLDWRDQSQSFEHLAAYDRHSFNYSGGEFPQLLRALAATDGFLQILGAQLQIGRPFLPGEYQPGRERVLILSHGLWQNSFSADPGILGKTIVLNDQEFAVAGVLQPRFAYGGQFDMLLPRTFTPGELSRRHSHSLAAIARLKENVSIEQARTEMLAIAERLSAVYPKSNQGWSVRLRTLPEVLTGSIGPQLFILLAAVGFLILIVTVTSACFIPAIRAARMDPLKALREE
jgi:putative ABC transport system permease protein